MPSPRRPEHPRLMSPEQPYPGRVPQYYIPSQNAAPQEHPIIVLGSPTPLHFQEQVMHTEPVTHYWQLKTNQDNHIIDLSSKQNKNTTNTCTSPLQKRPAESFIHHKTYANKYNPCMVYSELMTPDEAYCRNCPLTRLHIYKI